MVTVASNKLRSPDTVLSAIVSFMCEQKMILQQCTEPGLHLELYNGEICLQSLNNNAFKGQD